MHVLTVINVLAKCRTPYKLIVVLDLCMCMYSSCFSVFIVHDKYKQELAVRK